MGQHSESVSVKVESLMTSTLPAEETHPYNLREAIPSRTKVLLLGTAPPPRFSSPSCGEMRGLDFDFFYGSEDNYMWVFLDDIAERIDGRKLFEEEFSSPQCSDVARDAENAGGRVMLDINYYARHAAFDSKPTKGTESEQRQAVVQVASDIVGNEADEGNRRELLRLYCERCDPPWTDEHQVKILAAGKKHRAAVMETSRKQELEWKNRDAATKAESKCPNKKGTWSEIANAAGSSSRHVQEIAANGTTSRAAAPLLGVEVETLWKSGQRGGPRPTFVGTMIRTGKTEFPFRNFIKSTCDELAADDPQYDAIYNLAALYESDTPSPADFPCLEAFQSFAKAIDAGSTDIIGALWKRSKLWRIARVAERATDAVNAEEFESDDRDTSRRPWYGR
jgi:hypothetical protein